MANTAGFSFPPPPPPPPKAAPSSAVYQGSPRYYSQHGGRGDRGRGRSRGRGGSYRGYEGVHGQRGGQSGVLNHHFNGPSSHSLPLHPDGGAGAFFNPAGASLPQWQPHGHAAASQQPNSYLAQYPQPIAQPPHQHLQSFPNASYAGHTSVSNHVTAPAAPNGVSSQPHHPAGYAAWAGIQQSPQWDQPSTATTHAPAMGAPIRLGFDRQHQPQEQFSSYQCQGSNPELPNPSLFRNAPASANNPNRSSQGSDFHFNPQTGYGPPPRSTSYNQRNGYRGHDSSRGRGRGTPRGGREGTSNHRPTAPPAVPSFLSSTLPLPPKPPVPVIDRPKKKKKRKHNVLGLTPRTEEYEESEDDDVDEEAVLGAAALGNQAGLTFEYKGQTSTLQTSSDITAWIAERRKRFPTKRRIEEKQAEKERRWKEARERETQLQKDLKESEKQKTAKEALAASQAQSAATMNAEAVKKKRDRAMKKIRKHEKALAKLKAEVVERAKDIREVPADAGQKRKREDTESDNVGLKAEPSSDGVGEPKMGHEEIQMPPLKQEETIATVIITTPPTEQGPVDAPEATRPVLSKPISPIPLSIAGERLPLSVDHQKAPSSPVGSDDSMSSTSSSISSSSSSASEGDNPEETSSRRTGPVRVPPPRRQKPNETPLCRQFVRTGSCRRGGFNGGRCTYRHELPPSGAASLGGRDGKNNWNGRGGRGKGREENGRRRVGLYQRMVEAEKEKEDILVLKAIKHLAEKGMLKEPDAEAE